MARATNDHPGSGPATAEIDQAVPRWRWWPVPSMIVMGLALFAFVLYSWARTPIAFGHFAHPPLYGFYKPVSDRMALAVVPAGLLLAAVAWAVTSAGRRARRIPTWLALALIIGCGVVTAGAIGLVRGDLHDIIRGVSTSQQAPYYSSDLHFVYEYGVRGFVERHPDLTDAFHSYNSKTHPAGVHLVLFVLFEVFGAAHPLRIATGVAVLAMSAAVASWSIGRTLGGERAGRIAAVLFVAAPGPLMLSYTGMDAVYATAIATATALFLLAIYRQSPAIAAVGGAALAAATLLTFATVFVGLATAIAVVLQTRSVRTSLRLLGAAAGGGLAVMALARLTLGFDLVGSYLAVPKSNRPYDPYWIVASPAAWLLWAGLPIAVLGIAGLLVKAPRLRRPTLAAALVLIMVIWAALPAEFTKLRPGEVERTWAFLYPIIAGTAGPVIDRWSRGAGRRAGLVVAGLVVVAVAQATLLQALWDNLV